MENYHFYIINLPKRRKSDNLLSYSVKKSQILKSAIFNFTKKVVYASTRRNFKTKTLEYPHYL